MPPITRLFEEQARKTPEAIAVKLGTQQLSYAQLERRANQLARHLLGLGLMPEAPVVVLAEHSLPTIISILGILKAGCVYVPLPVDLPAKRMEFLVSDVNPRVVLGNREAVRGLPTPPEHAILFDDWEGALESLPGGVLESAPLPEQLAYVIYTSGSTGRPKGVLVEHKGLVNLAVAQARLFRLSPRSHVLQFASLGFDASISEIFTTLINGGKLVLVKREQLPPSDGFLSVLQDEAISAVTLPPAVLRTLPSVGLPKLETLVSAGEACPWDVVDRWAPGRLFLNGYGPTEVSVCASMAVVAGRVPGAATAPIGLPIDGTSLYVLDEALRPVKDGEPGELFIGGIGVARGYRHQPDLTAQRFLPDPFSEWPGARMYRSGDRVRRLPDGQLEFLERVDHQVKLRGFRIELWEIEALLAESGQVRACAVALQGDAENARLVAYVMPAKEELSVPELRHFLAERLPGYMIPAAFITLKEFPLTHNGKVDRARLPSVRAVTSGRASAAPPRTPEEEALVALWREILGVQDMGIHDDFFALGGHSLLALSLVDAIRKKLDLHVTTDMLLQNPTVAKLSSVMQRGKQQWSPLVSLQREGHKRPFFCIPAGTGIPFYLRGLAMAVGRDRPFYSFLAHGLDGTQEPHRTIEEMAASYIQALFTVQKQGPFILGGHSYGAKIALEMAKQLHDFGEEVSMLVALDASAPVAGSLAEMSMSWAEFWSVEYMAKTLERYSGRKFGLEPGELEGLSFDAQLSRVERRMVNAGLFPESAGTPPLRAIHAVVMASEAGRSYLPDGVQVERIVLFRATEVQEDDLLIDWTPGLAADAALGWGEFSPSPVEVYSTPGDHASMFQTPGVQVLGEQLGRVLDGLG